MAKKHERILTFDLMRGYLLSVIAIDHMFRFPNFLDIFTGRGELWVTAAEGFFLISGILVGFINKEKIQTHPGEVFKRCIKRAAVLYLISITLTVTSIILAEYLPYEFIKPGFIPYNDLLLLLKDILSLKYVYGWADFLPYYAAFMCIAPFVLLLLSKKRLTFLVFLSFFVWLFFRNSFYTTWQLLFTIGIICGYYKENVENYLKNKVKFKTLAMIAGVGIFISALFDLVPFLKGTNESLSPIFVKEYLGPGRLIFSLLFFSTAYLYVSKNEKKIDSYSHGYFKFLGKNSLLVYAIQAVVILIADAFLPQKANVFVNFVCTIFILGTIYFLTRLVSGFNLKTSKGALTGI